jgi:hypothetical protein
VIPTFIQNRVISEVILITAVMMKIAVVIQITAVISTAVMMKITAVI